MSGIERSVDKLGRIVLPIKYREKLGIKTDDKVIISLEKGMITVSPAEGVCALCGAEITESCRLRVCRTCIKRIKEEA
ncbi:MAG: AbrB/MazE/SpoVT family DNA-binding domain-containing protein [Clostridia bacterium]|nr:AbrB/MazE/SpoVT family DNA-binding domain-containing protein [Clostridia bacterium]